MPDAALLRFLTAALSGTGNARPLDLGVVSDANAALVRAITGLDIAGFARTLSSSEVRHIFKSHGDPVREAARGQVAIRKTDLVDLVAIIGAAAEVAVRGEVRGNKPRRLVYRSSWSGHMVEYVETIHPARRIVAVKTMRKMVIASGVPHVGPEDRSP